MPTTPNPTAPTLLHLASRNSHKAEEFQQLAAESGPPVRVVASSLMPEVVEDSGTYEGNARLKAAALRSLLPADAWVLADDSGLSVDALDGGPGVESAYYAGPEGDFAANLRKLTEVMRGVPKERRGAHFVCVLVLQGPGGFERVFEGQTEGRLLDEPAGGGGFGYDPLFVPAGENRSMAELDKAEKNALSHRSRAWKRLAAWLGGGAKE